MRDHLIFNKCCPKEDVACIIKLFLYNIFSFSCSDNMSVIISFKILKLLSYSCTIYLVFLVHSDRTKPHRRRWQSFTATITSNFCGVSARTTCQNTTNRCKDVSLMSVILAKISASYVIIWLWCWDLPFTLAGKCDPAKP